MFIIVLFHFYNENDQCEMFIFLVAQQLPFFSSVMLFFFHYYPSTGVVEPVRALLDVRIGILPQRWERGNEICGLSKGSA